MRTTLTLDEEVADQLKAEARRRRLPFKTVVNRALRLGLERLAPTRRKAAFRQRTFRLGAPAANFDKALQLAALLEDEETLRTLTVGR